MSKEDGEGEVIQFMRDIKKESEALMMELIEIDGMLSKLENRLRTEDVAKEETLKTIEQVRLRIGTLEKEDRREMNEEDVAESLLMKLKKWVNQVV